MIKARETPSVLGDNDPSYRWQGWHGRGVNNHGIYHDILWLPNLLLFHLSVVVNIPLCVALYWLVTQKRNNGRERDFIDSRLLKLDYSTGMKQWAIYLGVPKREKRYNYNSMVTNHKWRTNLSSHTEVTILTRWLTLMVNPSIILTL